MTQLSKDEKKFSEVSIYFLKNGIMVFGLHISALLADNSTVSFHRKGEREKK